MLQHLVLVVSTACAVQGGGRGSNDFDLPAVSEILLPSARNSRFPNLVHDGAGRWTVCWLEAVEGGDRLRYASADEEGVFADARTIAHGADWFVNWADFPAICVSDEGDVAAHWLERCGGGTYAYGVRFTLSRDGGRSFAPPRWLHDDTSAVEHGFASWVAMGGGVFEAVWLDASPWPRALSDPSVSTQDAGNSGPSGEMTLRTRRIGADDVLGPEQCIDPRVCECCSTDAVRFENAIGGRGIALVYRDRSADEVRDIGFATRSGDPRVVVKDGWERPG